MNTQRLRNLTTTHIHTSRDDAIEDIATIVGEPVSQSQFDVARKYVSDYLKPRILDQRVFDGKYDLTHEGEVDVPTMSAEDRAAFWAQYEADPIHETRKEMYLTQVHDRF
jgi:hypothetical protein